MNRFSAFVGVVCAALAAQAQAQERDDNVSVTVRLRAWYTQWTTFSYYAPDGENLALTQISAHDKLVMMPLVSVGWRDFIGSVSGIPSTRFTFDDGSSGRRSEFDANLGYSVTPGLALTVGYKRVTQSDGVNAYRPRGPVIGASANASLGGGLSLYGSLGIGRLKTASGDSIQYKAGYRLAELGLGYGLNGDWPRWTLTGGYRIQVMSSKDAFQGQDGRDTTQGFTVGASASF